MRDWKACNLDDNMKQALHEWNVDIRGVENDSVEGVKFCEGMYRCGRG
jgi:hypothetical protein